MDQEELTTLIEANIEDAIEENDDQTDFSINTVEISVTTVSTATTGEPGTGENNTNDINDQVLWIMIVVLVSLAVLIVGLGVYYVSKKRKDETVSGNKTTQNEDALKRSRVGSSSFVDSGETNSPVQTNSAGVPTSTSMPTSSGNVNVVGTNINANTGVVPQMNMMYAGQMIDINKLTPQQLQQMQNQVNQQIQQLQQMNNMNTQIANGMNLNVAESTVTAPGVSTQESVQSSENAQTLKEAQQAATEPALPGEGA